jgi:uncharacterized membrane protein YciS (DUF1049 family)
MDSKKDRILWGIANIPGVLLFAATTLPLIDKFVVPVPNLRDWIIANLKYDWYATVSLFFIGVLLFLVYQTAVNWLRGRLRITKLRKRLVKEKNKMFTELKDLTDEKLQFLIANSRKTE